ncbi:MAG: SDR family NAD(P)-dependent oxidoreductase [Anaerolineales bacterium]|nr:SDR family NAD(P)-dependent oxidoreductase [Anaerolineales bacterium]
MRKEKMDGKVAIITGASSGIGEATALKLSEKGIKVALAARREQELKRVENKVVKAGGIAKSIPTDVTSRDQVKDLVSEVLNKWGTIDIVVVNAGAYLRAKVEELSVKDIEQSMAVNFYGGLYLILEVLPIMLKNGQGRIIVVTSFDAKKGLPLDAPYVAAKFAMSGFAEVMRQELKPKGILVTTIFPGRVDTPLITDLKVPSISAKISPGKVAQAICKVIYKYRPEIILPKQAGLLYYLNVISPRLGDYLVKLFRLEGWYE